MMDVHASLTAVEAAPPGDVMVLLLRPEHAPPLNMGRPIFAQRKLKAVLWCDHQTTLALAQGAPDFFDWISEHHECPQGPALHVVQGLLRAGEAEAPGIVWRGPGDAADTEQLWSAFAAAFPGQKLVWIDPRRDYEALVDTIRGAGDGWIACHAQARAHVTRVRWALAEARREGRAIVVTDTHPCPGWWPVHARLLPFEEARAALHDAGCPRPGALAALLGLEPEAVELARALLAAGTAPESLAPLLAPADDPGASLAIVARREGLLRGDLSAGEPAPPVLRAYGREIEEKRRRAAASAARLPDLSPGHSALHLVWYLDAFRPPRAPARSSVDAVVPTLRASPSGDTWIALARAALDADQIDAAAVWALRAENQEHPTIASIKEELARHGEPRAWGLGVGSPGTSRLLDPAGWALVAIAGALVLTVLLAKGPGAFILALLGLVMAVGRLIQNLTARRDTNVARETVGWWATGGPTPTVAELESRQTVAWFESSVRAALALFLEGTYEEAIDLLEPITIHGEGALSEEHPSYRRALELLARALVERGEDERAGAVLDQAIALEGRLAGVEGPSFAVLARLLAASCLGTGRTRDAETLLRKLLGAGVPASLPGEDDQAAEPQPRGLRITRRGDADAGAQLRLFLAMPGEPPLSGALRATAIRLLAEVRITQGRYGEAMDLLRPMVDEGAAPYPRRWRTLTTYGRLLALQRRPELAEPVLRRALALAEEGAGERHPDAARALAELARVEHRLGRPQAPATARRALDLYADAQLAEGEKTLVRGELRPIADAP